MGGHLAQVVLLLDVDFLPPEELSRIFSGRQEYQSTLVYLYNNAVIVLPAFETLQGGADGQSLALKLAKGAATRRLRSGGLWCQLTCLCCLQPLHDS